MNIRRDPSLILAALLLAPAAQAADINWTGTTNTDFNNIGNWNTGTVPNGATGFEIGTSTPNPATLSGNWTTTGAGVKTISGTGSMTLNSGRFINNGTFNVSGGSFTQVGEYFIVGEGSNGVGTFNHSGGTVNVTHLRGFQLSNNAVSQSGSAYNLSGTAVLNVISDANYSDGNLRHVWLGKGGDTAGAVPPSLSGDVFNVSGGTATFQKNRDGAFPSEIRISRNSGLLVSGGSITFNDYANMSIGYQTSTTPNTRVEVSGGTLTLNEVPQIYVGSGDPGTLKMTGGILNATKSVLSVGINANGSGTASTGAGSVVMTGGTMRISYLAAQNGTFDYRGGDLYILDDFSGILDSEVYPWFITANAMGTVKVDFDPVELVTHIHIDGVTQTGYNAWLAQCPTLSDTATTADPDGDGIINLLEYVLGGNPSVSSPSIAPVASLTADNYVFSFTRGTASTADTTQKFQYSTDLATWTDVNVNAAVAGSVTVTAVPSTNTEKVQVTIPRSRAVNGKLFGRLTATKP